MRFRARRRIILLGLVFLATFPSHSATSLGCDGMIGRLPAGGLASRDDVDAFYVSRDGEPAWTAGRPARAHLGAVMGELNRAGAEGLDPHDYHVRALNHLTTRPDWMLTDSDLVLRDILLTDALFTYGRHLAGDRDVPGDLRGDVGTADCDLRPVERLSAALETGEDLHELLEALRPDHPAYQGLIDQLARYRGYAEDGEWPLVSGGPALRQGGVDARVMGLRDRLAAEGYGGVRTEGDPCVYDAALARAVRHAQARFGLETDGVVGPATLDALGVPARERAAQIELNLERLRRLPRGCDGEAGRTVLVNIPAFTLEVIEHGRTVLSMRAIVGRPDRPTPVLSSTVTWLEVNPYWNIPMKLARHDVLPHIQCDPAYLAERDIRVYENWRPGAREIAAANIDWSSMSAAALSYKLQQAPGPLNPLGRVKFMFDNDHSVYIHDTPGRAKFDAARRTFSSGCVRVEDPLTLAAYLLNSEDPRADAEFQQAYTARTNRKVGLPRPVPVHLVYLTAWTDDEDVLHFRDDVYGYDTPRLEAVAAR